MHVKETPVWLEGVTFPTIDPTRPLTARADVAIVGGGYTGLAAARELARRGAAGGAHARLGRQLAQWRHGADWAQAGGRAAGGEVRPGDSAPAVRGLTQ